MNQDYSTGNRIVDEVGSINISGNIIPMVWFQAIRYPNGKPNVNAIIILADIVYWYRPTEIRDEITGQVVGRRKKFRDDLLQRSYGQISELFGLTKKQVVTAVNALEQMGVIKRNLQSNGAESGKNLLLVLSHQDTVTNGDFKSILVRNCEDTEQLHGFIEYKRKQKSGEPQSAWLFYASNEPKSVLARDLGDCRDNQNWSIGPIVDMQCNERQRV